MLMRARLLVVNNAPQRSGWATSASSSRFDLALQTLKPVVILLWAARLPQKTTPDKMDILDGWMKNILIDRFYFFLVGIEDF
jgi:hypothetical protein